jgi:hypothetical protein
MKKVLFALCCIAGLIASCSKETLYVSPTTTTPETTTATADMLTAHDWSMTKHERGTVGNFVNVTETMAECDKDDYMKFEAGNVLKHFSGTSMCELATEEVTTGSWDLPSNKQLTLNDRAKTTTYTIEEMYYGHMVLTTDIGGELHKITYNRKN